MGEQQQGRTTKAVLDMMKADAERRGVPLATAVTAQAAPEKPRPAAMTLSKPLSGHPSDLVDLAAIDTRARDIKLRLLSDEERGALAERVKAGPGKLEAAGKAGATVQQLTQAALKLTSLEDQLAADMLDRVRHYLLSAAYLIGRDFREKAGNGLRSVLDTGDISALSVNVPGVISFRLDLGGPDDEPPF